MNNSSCNLLQAFKIDDASRDVSVGFYSIAICVGLVANILILLVLIRRRKLSFASDVYFLNATIGDIITTATLPIWMYYELNYSQFNREACISFSISFYTPLFVQAWLMISIAMERYSSLIWMAPIKRKVAIQNSIGTWIVCAFVSSPFYVFRNAHDGRECILGNYTWQTNEPLHTILDAFITICTFISPVATTIVVGVKMRKATWGNRKLNKSTSYTLFMMAGTAICFWGPFHIMLVIDNILQRMYTNPDCNMQSIKHYLLLATGTLVYLRAIVNPVIYIAVKHRLRREINYLFLRHPYEELSQSSTNTIELAVRRKKRKAHKKTVTWSDEVLPKYNECFL
uniref:Chemokine receptor-like protein n=1 Tax=Simian cytomegalovirus TaxID=10364 RepID=Q6VFU4_SCMVC|nr:chemokine receptor-like protein [Simian cytomegalovirus]